jgi:UDP-GlcNAc3NAcA epimerase
MKVVTIVGARPQFIKAAPLSRVLRQHHTEILVHTGQHYDDNMSAVFFDELEIPRPDYNLGIGSGLHGAQTGAMLSSIEQVLVREQPDCVLIYGDTNSSLAGALAATKLFIRVAHVEAGLRSFNRRMPEEINRVVADHLSDLLLCPSQTAVDNLTNEGIRVGVHLVGDVMADALAFAAARATSRSNILERSKLTERGYLLATVHRPENTDNVSHLRNILAAFAEINETIIFPVHPRTRKALESAGLGTPSGGLRLIDPVGYLDMVQLESSARMILTDSGGMQKEAYWLGVPCVTLRGETEWVETVQTGWNQIVGADRQRIVQAVQSFVRPADHPPLYVDGSAALRCVTYLESAPVSR